MEHNVKQLVFNQIGDERGKLVAIEGNQNVPFDIKRIFYIYGTDREAVRGQHANRKSEFVLINIAGTSKVKVNDGKGTEITYCLNTPYTGVYIPRMVWKDMFDFSEDSVLLCISSEHYDSKEYIRNYEEFINEIQGHTYYDKCED